MTLETAPFAFQIAIVAALMYVVSGAIKHGLELHEQGFFKLLPNGVMLGTCTAVAYLAHGPLVAVFASVVVGLGLVTVAQVKRTLKRAAERMAEAEKPFAEDKTSP